MDGNGRWALARGRPREEGHIAGATAVASAKAYLGALNKLTSKRNKTSSVERRIHSTDVG